MRCSVRGACPQRRDKDSAMPSFDESLVSIEAALAGRYGRPGPDSERPDDLCGQLRNELLGQLPARCVESA